MSTVVTPDPATRAELVAVEERRRAALLAGDIRALEDLYDDTLLHVHAPGVVHTKAQLLEHVATRQAYLDMWRDELDIRLIGDIALMTGRLTNRLRNPDGGERLLGGVVTQVLRRCADGAWRFLNFQMTPDGEQVWGELPSEQAAGAQTNGENHA